MKNTQCANSLFTYFLILLIFETLDNIVKFFRKKALKICDNQNLYYICSVVKQINTLTMNKSELIDAMAKDANITKVAAKAALESFMGNVTKTLKKKDGKVSLVGFGTFSVAQRAARQGINPSTKKPIKIAAKKVAKFKAGSELANAVNGGKK